MCGRFTLTTPGSILAESFGVPELQDLDRRYNIAPTQPVACVRPASARPGEAAGAPRQDPGGDEGEDRGPSGPPRLELAMLRWGLVPHWADDPAIGNRMINARSETVAEKPAFRDAFRKRRCLVLADGFYEWKRLDGRKQPYYVRMADGRPFAFAGLWEHWRPRCDADRPAGGDRAGDGSAGGGGGSGAGAPIESCTVLTTPPNELLEDIHGRMPVILPRERYGEWLDPARPGDGGATLRQLLSPYPAEEMEAYPVSTFVNAPANDSARCIEPLYAEPKREQQQESKQEQRQEPKKEQQQESKQEQRQEPKQEQQQESKQEQDRERPRTGRLF